MAKMVAPQKKTRALTCPYRVALYGNILKAKDIQRKTRKKRTCPQAEGKRKAKDSQQLEAETWK